MTIDILPTLCNLANVPLPKTEIDGKNVWDLIAGKEGAKNPHDYYAFTNNSNIEAVMSGDGKWKLHLPHNYRTLLDSTGNEGMPGKYNQEKIELSLFDMQNDPFETTNVIEQNNEVAAKLIAFTKAHKEKFYTEE